MITTTTPTSNQLIVTVDESVNIPTLREPSNASWSYGYQQANKKDYYKYKGLIQYRNGKSPQQKKTMKAIEEAEQGKGMVEVNSMENYMKLVENL